MRKRPSTKEYFMSLALLAASRSTCLRRQVGALAVLGKRVLATGYNGPPSGISHCGESAEDRPCLRTALDIPSGERLDLCHAVHAEQNVMIQAARYGIALAGCDIYCTHMPCFTCAKMLVNMGVVAIYYMHAYPDRHLHTTSLFEEAKVRLRQIPIE